MSTEPIGLSSNYDLNTHIISPKHTTMLMRNTVFKGGDNLKKSHKNDAGYDIRSAESIKLLPDCSYAFQTGLHVAIPIGYEGHVRPRSGLGFKHDIVPFQGTIDSSYRSEVMVKVYNNSDIPYQINKGDRIAQLVVSECRLDEFIEVDELPLPDDGRGDNGLGSSGA